MKRTETQNNKSVETLNEPIPDNSHNRELYQALANNDQAAFGAYYLRVIKSFVRFITGLVGSEEDAKEIAQDVFAYIWENRASLKSQMNMNGYIYGTARNMAYKLIHKRGIHTKYHTEKLHTSNIFDSEADTAVLSEETRLYIEMTIKKMPPQRRRVFEMSRREGLAYAEIAARLGISVNAVHKHIKIALKELREVLTVFLVLLLLR